jgi:hypothetical protein
MRIARPAHALTVFSRVFVTVCQRLTAFKHKKQTLTATKSDGISAAYRAVFGRLSAVTTAGWTVADA